MIIRLPCILWYKVFNIMVYKEVYMSKNNAGKLKGKRIVKIVLLDIAGYIGAMGVFLLFFYIVPYKLEADGTMVGDSSNMTEFEIPASDAEESTSESSTGTQYNKKGRKGEKTNRGNTDTENISSNAGEAEQVLLADVTEEEKISYKGENISITVTQNTYGSGSDKVTYYVADVYVTSLSYLKTAFAEDTYGTNIKEDIVSMSESNNAILSITGDSYGNNNTGIVVRNGVLYRADENEADVCVLFADGNMKTYTADEFDSETVLAENVWQAWCFGPGLLDSEGNILEEFNSTDYISGNHPRASIGCVSPGHYILTIVDGRDEGYSRGVTLSELAAIMKREGCETAYNLDGGGSASMVFNGEYVNKSQSREITDIIYISEK